MLNHIYEYWTVNNFPFDAVKVMPLIMLMAKMDCMLIIWWSSYFKTKRLATNY